MKEYIEREAALKMFCGECHHGSDGPYHVPCGVPCEEYYRMANIPAADVRHIVRGVWVPCGESAFFPGAKICTCSVCDHPFFGNYNYCPNCGADMRGENDEAD